MAFGKKKEKTYPVMTTYPEYTALKERWSVCREVIAGEDVVKEKGEKYLPMATHKCADVQSARYKAYKMLFISFRFFPTINYVFFCYIN